MATASRISRAEACALVLRGSLANPDGSECTIVWFREIPWSEVVYTIIEAEEECLSLLKQRTAIEKDA